jgi:hypothetical protein
MRFKDFLTGRKTPDAVELVREKCQPFIDLNLEHALYRGDRSETIKSPVRTVNVNKQRKPVDTEQHVHDAMDQWFHKEFGTKLRSEALFCSGSASFAKGYGTLHCVFPVGDFKYFWASGYLNDDPKLKSRALGDSLILSQWIRDKARTKPAADLPAITADILDKVDWRVSDLDRALRSGAEVMLLCDQAVLINSAYLDKNYQSYEHFMKLVRGE